VIVNVTRLERVRLIPLSYFSHSGDDILISWDVKYILKDERERTKKMKKVYDEGAGESRTIILRISTAITYYLNLM